MPKAKLGEPAEAKGKEKDDEVVENTPPFTIDTAFLSHSDYDPA